MCFRKKWVCVCVWPSPITEPKLIDRSRSISISRVLSQISRTHFFYFHPNPKIKGSSHKKKCKIFIFSKMASTISIKFCGFIVHSKHNNMTLSAFPGKIPDTGKTYFQFFPSPNAGPKLTHQSSSKSISRVLSQISRTLVFSFHPNPKIKGSSHKKKIKKILFYQKWLQLNSSNFVGLQ